MTLDEFAVVVLIVALLPVAIIQWMGLIVAVIERFKEQAMTKEACKQVTMEYNRPEQGFEVYRCSNCQTDMFYTEYCNDYNYCPGCGRKIKEWK